MNWQAGDIVLTETGGGWGVLRPLVSWLFGKWGHCMIYVFSREDVPYFVESRPRKGVSLISGTIYKNYEVAVYRGKYRTMGAAAAVNAIEKSDDPSTIYDFRAIPLYIIPKLLFRKIGIRIGPKWQPDSFTICSELVWSCYAEEGITWNCDGIPLPSDFTKFSGLTCVYEGELSMEEWHNGT